MHPPTSPFGSASFDGDNTLAQVVVVPQFRAKSFSNHYHINKVMGNYSGLASLNLSNQLRYPGRRIDPGTGLT
jgi:hypothetical protein